MTSDGGLILVRELEERFGLSELIGQHLVDFRTGRNRQFPLADLLRQSVYSRLAGYEDLNDAAPVVGGPNLPADGFGEGLGARRSADLDAALVRDGLAGAGGELGGSGEAQSGTGGPGGRGRLTLPNSPGHG